MRVNRRLAGRTPWSAAGPLAGLLLALAASLATASVPTPESHFGHKIGADRTVLDWERVVSYFHALEAASDRILLHELGTSTEGRPLLAAIISSPRTLKRLDRFQWIQRQLADPRATPPAEAGKLIAEGKAVVLITCSIHSTEIASTHTAVEFTHRLLTEDNPRFRQILDNVILILAPSLNPDGVDTVARWYHKTLGTPYEGANPPELYHKYAGHDNNRDWYFFALKETRLAVGGLHNAWHPQIHYDVHEMGRLGARMFVPPWIDPVDPNIDPLIVQQCNQFGAGIAADLTAAGRTGVVVSAMYDLWSPSRHYAAYHGGLRMLSESASARLATPVVVRPGQLERDGTGFDPRRSSWNHLEPWPGGEWRLRDIIDYQSIAWESLLLQAAQRREDLLGNFYRIGQRALERTSPYAFVLPANQRDPGAARKLLETLMFGLVEIERAAEPFQAGSRRYPAGSHVIRLRQPYGAFAKTLLERQQYPDLRESPGGPPRRPYDATAHTLPLLLGVEVDTLEAPFPARLERLSEVAPPPPPGDVLPASDSDSWRRLNEWWDAGRQVWRDPATGDFHSPAAGGGGLVPLRRPRIAVYRSFVPSMDAGWTRWVLEEFGFPYVSAGNADIHRGALRERHEVIVLPDQPPEVIEHGFAPGTMPDEFCGGLGDEGALSLRQFLLAGGTLVFLNHSAEYANDRLGLGLKNVVRGLPETEYSAPGSLVWASVETTQPLALGLPNKIAVWSQHSPAWEWPDSVPARAVAQYAGSGILASGWLTGEKLLAGRAAVVELHAGLGKAVLFGLRPQYRGQSWQTLKLFFNALTP